MKKARTHACMSVHACIMCVIYVCVICLCLCVCYVCVCVYYVCVCVCVLFFGMGTYMHSHLGWEVFDGDVHGNGLLLLLEEALANELWQRGQDALIRQEQVIQLAQLPFGLMRLIFAAQFGEAHHLGHAALALEAIHHGLGLLVALALVVLDEQAQVRALGAEQRVREGQGDGLVLALLQRHLLQRELQKKHLGVCVRGGARW